MASVVAVSFCVCAGASFPHIGGNVHYFIGVPLIYFFFVSIY